MNYKKYLEYIIERKTTGLLAQVILPNETIGLIISDIDLHLHVDILLCDGTILSNYPFIMVDEVIVAGLPEHKSKFLKLHK